MLFPTTSGQHQSLYSFTAAASSQVQYSYFNDANIAVNKKTVEEAEKAGTIDQREPGSHGIAMLEITPQEGPAGGGEGSAAGGEWAAGGGEWAAGGGEWAAGGGGEWSAGGGGEWAAGGGDVAAAGGESSAGGGDVAGAPEQASWAS